MADSFEVELVESVHGPGRVLVTEGVEYYYVEGIDSNEVRLPKEPDLLVQIAELISHLLNRATN